jgi:hypothetical protein
MENNCEIQPILDIQPIELDFNTWQKYCMIQQQPNRRYLKPESTDFSFANGRST